MLMVLGRRTSINVRKVLWACAEIGLPLEQMDGDTDLAAWTATPTGLAFTVLFPNAMVPVLLDHDFVLWESNSILRYLANRYGDGTFYPFPAKERACVDQWLDWQASDLNPAWSYAFMALVRQSVNHADTARIQASLGAWTRFMSVLDARLMQTRAWVAGPNFSLADIALGLSVHRWLNTPFDRSHLQGVHDYYHRIARRPGFALYCAGAP